MEYQKPEYSMSFDDDSGKVIEGSNQSLSSLAQQAFKSMAPVPVIDEIPDTLVTLPAGMAIGNEIIREAEVRELTGEHEELLAKAKSTNNAAKYINTLLQCGVVSIGDKIATPELLDQLIQGDLDALILGIRRATFGDEFEVVGIPCLNCEELNDLTLDLADIPVKELDDPYDRDFIVDLRKGRKARVQFPTGAVQNEIFKKPLSVVQMNSITLAACVLSFIEKDGSEKPCNGLSDVNKLGIADRKTLEKYLYDKQPGPRYDQVTAQCHSCESEMTVPLNVGILFREL